MSIPASLPSLEGSVAHATDGVADDALNEDRARAAVQGLREAELRYRALVEQIPAITYTEVDDPLSPTGTIAVYISPQSTAILGYTPEEFAADPGLWDTLVHPDDLTALLLSEREVDGTGSAFEHEYRICDRDGRIHWFHDQAVLVQDEATGLRFWQGVMTDITEKKLALDRMEEAEVRYKSLVETLPAMVFIDRLDEAATNVYTSPQTTTILGYTPEDWREDPELWWKIIHPDDLERVGAANRDSGQLFDEEYRMIAKDGRLVWVRDVAMTIAGVDGEEYAHGFLLDVTAQKVAEGALKEALAREHQAVEQLRELDQLKNTLLHALSHDLKSPLTAIIGAATSLSNPDLQLTDDERDLFLRGLVDRAIRMNGMLTDLLDLDRLDRGLVEPHRAPTDIGELCRLVVAHCDAVLIRPVVIDVGEVSANVDAAKVERIVENLLVNAARYTPEHTRILVRAQRVDGGVEIVVNDEGPGVPDEMKMRIFGAFERGSDAASGGAGTGIGLSLVSRFAALHGGRAWVEDRPGGGASFHVYLPD